MNAYTFGFINKNLIDKYSSACERYIVSRVRAKKGVDLGLATHPHTSLKSSSCGLSI